MSILQLSFTLHNFYRTNFSKSNNFSISWQLFDTSGRVVYVSSPLYSLASHRSCKMNQTHSASASILTWCLCDRGGSVWFSGLRWAPAGRGRSGRGAWLPLAGPRGAPWIQTRGTEGRRLGLTARSWDRQYDCQIDVTFNTLMWRWDKGETKYQCSGAHQTALFFLEQQENVSVWMREIKLYCCSGEPPSSDMLSESGALTKLRCVVGCSCKHWYCYCSSDFRVGLKFHQPVFRPHTHKDTPPSATLKSHWQAQSTSGFDPPVLSAL